MPQFESLEHHIEIERKIIHLMLSYRDAIDEILDDNITDAFFDEKHQLLVNAIFQEYVSSGHKRLLSRPAYQSVVIITKRQQSPKRVDEKPIDIPTSLKVFDQCSIGEDAELDDLGQLKKELVESYVDRRAKTIIDEYWTDRTKRGSVRASRSLVDKMSASLDLTETRESVFCTLSDLKTEYLDQLKALRDNPEQIIECNIPEIDRALNVGFRPGHLTLFAGDVGSHKSNMMMNVALNLYEAGHNVLFVPLEMSRIDLANRVIANRVHIPVTKLSHPHDLLDDEVKRIEESKVWLEHNHRFAILDVSERTSVDSLKRQIEKHAIYFKPQVVIIDYIALMEMDTRTRNDLAIGEILKNLRFMGRKYGFHIISAAQIGRAALTKIRQEGFDAARPDSTALRGSHEYSADADTIIALFTEPEEPSRLRIYILKARHGRAGKMENLHLDAEYCNIYSGEVMPDAACTDTGDPMEGDKFLNEPAAKAAAVIHSDEEWAHAPLDLDDPEPTPVQDVNALADGQPPPDDLLNRIG